MAAQNLHSGHISIHLQFVVTQSAHTVIVLFCGHISFLKTPVGSTGMLSFR